MMKLFEYRMMSAGLGLFLFGMGICTIGSASVAAASGSDSLSAEVLVPFGSSDAELPGFHLALADEADSAVAPPPPPPVAADDEPSPQHPDASEHRYHRRSPRWQPDQETAGGPPDVPAPDVAPDKDHRNSSGPSDAMPRKLTPEQIQIALEILHQQNPPLAQRIRQAMEKHPDDVNRLILQQWRRLGRLVEMKKRDPVLFGLTMDEFRLHRQVWQIRNQLSRPETSPEQTATLHIQLKEHIEKLFDIRQSMRQQEIQKLEKRIEEVRQQIQTSQADRQNLINKRVDELLKKKPAASASASEPDQPPPPVPHPPHSSSPAP